MPDLIGCSSGRVGAKSHDHLDPGRGEQGTPGRLRADEGRSATRRGRPCSYRSASSWLLDAAGLVALGAQDVEGHRGRRLLRCSPVPASLAFSSASGWSLAVFVGGLDRAEARHGKSSRSATELGVAAGHDVGASTCRHVGGDGDGALAGPLLGDDRGLTRVILRVQHLVADALVLEHPRQPLGLLDAGRAVEDLPNGLVAFLRWALMQAMVSASSDQVTMSTWLPWTIGRFVGIGTTPSL